MQSEGRVTRSRSRIQGGLTPASELKTVRGSTVQSKPSASRDQESIAPRSALFDLTNTATTDDHTKDRSVSTELTDELTHLDAPSKSADVLSYEDLMQESALNATDNINNTLTESLETKEAHKTANVEANSTTGVSPCKHAAGDQVQQSLLNVEETNHQKDASPLVPLPPVIEEAEDSGDFSITEQETDNRATIEKIKQSSGARAAASGSFTFETTAIGISSPVLTQQFPPTSNGPIPNHKESQSLATPETQSTPAPAMQEASRIDSTPRSLMEECTPGQVFAKVQQEISHLDRTPHPRSFLESFKEGDYRRQQVKSILQQCPHEINNSAVQSRYGVLDTNLDYDKQTAEKQEVTNDVPLPDQISLSPEVNVVAEILASPVVEICDDDTLPCIVSKPAGSCTDGVTDEPLDVLDDGGIATVDETTTLPDKEVSSLTKAPINKGLITASQLSRWQMEDGDINMSDVQDNMSEVLGKCKVQGNLNFAEPFEKACVFAAEEQVQEPFDRWEMEGARSLAAVPAVPAEEQVVVKPKVKSKVVVTDEYDDRSMLQLKKAIRKKAEVLKSRRAARGEPESSVDTTQLPVSTSSTHVTDDGESVDGPLSAYDTAVEQSLCDGLTDLGLDLKMPLRGIAAPQGRHVRFTDEGQAVESPSSRYTYLRGVPPPKGSHVHFDD